MTTAAKLAAYIRKAGLPVIGMNEQDEYIDAHVNVTEEISVHICRAPIGYCVSTYFIENGEPAWMSHKLRQTKKAIVTDLRRVLANA